MSTTALIINGLAVIGLLISFYKDKDKTVRALKVAGKTFINLLPITLIIIILVGFLMGFVPPTQIESFFGQQSGVLGILTISIIGALIHIPSLIAFPLAGSLLESGASTSSVAAFITTLTMVGTAFIPLEIKILGKKFALLRNGLSFVVALLIALIIGLIL